MTALREVLGLDAEHEECVLTRAEGALVDAMIREADQAPPAGAKEGSS